MTKDKKKRVFSGVQPSGTLHLGNYLGAISRWVRMQEEYDCVFCVVDYHAITVRFDPASFQKKVIETAKVYLASGINPAKSIIFQQSDIAAHTELAWILNCLARLADLNKMTQFKEKSATNKETVSVGLYDYPVLMAADILLYQTDAVPVGEDQSQHVEITRTLARRFNSQFDRTFVIPELIIQPAGARIMALDDPKKKMSKSAGSAASYIALTDEPATAAKKITRAVTDSGQEIIFDQKNKPALANLMTIHSLLSGESAKQLEKKFSGRGYADFKKELAEVTGQFLADFQKKLKAFDDRSVEEILRQGADQARPLANQTLKIVKEKIGLGSGKS